MSDELFTPIEATVSGYTPLIDSLVQQYGLVRAAVFGRIWRYCCGEQRVCSAALTTIADELGLERTTIWRHIEALIEDGYIADLTPSVRRRPHKYADTGKARIVSRISVAENNTEIKGSVAQNNTGVAENNTEGGFSVAENNSKRQREKRQDKKQRARVKRAPSTRQSDPRTQHPAIQLVRELRGILPPKINYDDLIAALGESPDRVKATACYKAWTARGHKPTNLAPFLEWYVTGIPARPSGNGKHAPNNATVRKAKNGVEVWVGDETTGGAT